MTMFSLTRKEFLDWQLGPEDLDDFADLWLAWQEEARRGRLRKLRGYHAVGLRLYGFARPWGSLLKEELQRRLAECGWPYTADMSDADVLLVSGDLVSGSGPCALGDWLALVRGPAFSGLAVTLRLSAHDWPGPPGGPPHAGDTLALCGRLEEGGLLLKALWPAGLDPRVEPLFERAAQPAEGDNLRAFKRYRRGGPVPARPPHIFAPRRTQAVRWLLVSLLRHLPGGLSRWRWFWTRTALHLGGLLLGIGLSAVLAPGPGKAVLTFGAVFFGGALAYVLVVEAARVAAFHRNMTASLKRVYSRPLAFEPVDLAALGVQEDPNAVKYSTELELLGCRHLADVRPVPGPSGTCYCRVFTLPGKRLYIVLNLLFATGTFKKFPAHAFLVLSTYFEDLHVVSLQEGGGFRKPLLPHVVARVYPGVQDPATLIAAHGRLVEQKQAAGHVLAPPLDAPALFERMAQDHEGVAAATRRRGRYSWPAAVRQSFGLVRRDMRGDTSLGDRAGGCV
jgi:hypothetical protein